MNDREETAGAYPEAIITTVQEAKRFYAQIYKPTLPMLKRQFWLEMRKIKLVSAYKTWRRIRCVEHL